MSEESEKHTRQSRKAVWVLPEDLVHVLNIHTIEKKKINSGFQRSGNELTDYVKRNIFSFSRVISEKRKKKYRDKTTMNELIREGWGGGGGGKQLSIHSLK